MDISRRALLLAAASTPIVVAGCSTDTDTPEAPKSPDDAARTATANSEVELIAAYRAAAAAEPGKAATYDFLAKQHEEHLASVFPDDGQPTVPAPSGTTLNRKALRQLEQQAARQRTEAAITAEDTALVELLARIAASEAGHAAYLQGGA